MDRDTLVELLPHYVVMLFLAFLALEAVHSLAGNLGFWVEFLIIGVVIFSYRPAVVRLGVAPSTWE